MKLSISKKFAKRSIKCLALFAPLAYLFGSLFFGLNGSHNGFPYAEPVYADTYVQVDSFTEDVSMIVLPSDNVNSFFNADVFFNRTAPYRNAPFTVNNVDYNAGLTYSSWTSSNKSALFQQGSSYIGIANLIDGVVNVNPLFANGMEIYSDNRSLSIFIGGQYSYFEMYVLMSLPTDTVPTGEGANSDYVFKQFFAKDNFLVQWGENAISDNPVGFAPFGTFFKLLDDNIFHLSDSQIGLMAYGYLYYCLHVLIACLAFDIVAFIPLFVQRVQDKLGGKEDD